MAADREGESTDSMTVRDVLKYYGCAPAKGGEYEPGDYWVDKPVFEALAKEKVRRRTGRVSLVLCLAHSADEGVAVSSRDAAPGPEQASLRARLRCHRTGPIRWLVECP